MKGNDNMNVSSLVAFGMMLLFGTVAFAEDRCELSFGYSYLRFRPTMTGLEPVPSTAEV
jgi:hypothetical protein